jgi:hypothetical protein
VPELAQGEPAHTDDELIDECTERFKFAQDAEATNRKEAEFDKRFVNGDQWDPTIRDERFSDRRPCLTVNLTDAICRRVINSCRENRPRIVTHPVGSGADVRTAKVYDGLIRHIEYASDASYAYDIAVENTVDGGWGWIGVEGYYPTDESWDQELRIVGVSNPMMHYGDPNDRSPDGSGQEWHLETSMMRRTAYRQQYGQLDQGGWKWAGTGDDVPDWSNKEEIRLCKYWRVERVRDKLLKLSDGSAVLESRIKDKHLKLLNLESRETRDVWRRQVRCYLLTAFKVLKTQDRPGKWIPWVPVYGRRKDINGRMELKGMVRDLRDPARIYNYAKTNETEVYALNPKAQWVGAAGFMEGKEKAWRDTNRKPIVALEYVPVRAENGELLPPPQRLDPPAINAGFAAWAEGTKSDFLQVAGMPHDPDADKKGEVISGLAIKRREGLADISNFDFYDNLVRSLRQVGRIIVDLVPSFYDTQRMIRIIREDGTPETIQLYQQTAEGILHDLTKGEYEVVVDTGPSYQTKREQSAEALMELLGTELGKVIAQVAGDKVIRQFDFPDAEGVADRVASVIPAAQAEMLKDLPPKAQALVAGLQQQMQHLQQVNQQLQMEVKTKAGVEQMRQSGEDRRTEFKENAQTQRTQMELEVRREDALTKAQTAREDTHVKAVTAHDVAEINVAGKMMDSHLDRQHEREMGEREFAREAAMTHAEMSHESLENARGRAHESSEAAAGREHQSTEAQRDRKHSSSESQHQRGHETRQSREQGNREKK